MYKISDRVEHDEVQGTDEWLALRESFRTASQTGEIMGVGYGSREDFMKQELSGEKPDNSGMEYIYKKGHDAEDLARQKIEDELGVTFSPKVFSSTVTNDDGIKVDFLASLDGIEAKNETMIFEHKLWSKERNKAMQSFQVHGEGCGMLAKDQYQVEFQLMISRANKGLFCISNLVDSGTKRKEPEYIIYSSVQSVREDIIAAWVQYEADIKDYKPAVEGESKCKDLAKLPDLLLTFSGAEVASNTLPAFTKAVEQFVGDINCDLKDDQDFANAKEDVKLLNGLRDDVKHVKQSALKTIKPIKDALDSLDELDDLIKNKVNPLDKDVKNKVKKIKDGIADDGKEKYQKAFEIANASIAPYVLPPLDIDFRVMTKNTRTIAGAEKKVGEGALSAINKINELHGIASANIKSLSDLAGDEHKLLFPDFSKYLLSDNDLVQGMIKARLSEHLAIVEKAKAEAEEKAAAAEKAEAAEKAAAEAEVEGVDGSSLAYTPEKEAFTAPDAEPDATYTPSAPAPKMDDPTEFKADNPEGMDAGNVVNLREENPFDPELEQKRTACKRIAWQSMVSAGFDKAMATKVISAIAEGVINGVKLDT